MTETDRVHPGEPAEGGEQPGDGSQTGRTPHPEQPAEGPDTASGPADTPGN